MIENQVLPFATTSKVLGNAANKTEVAGVREADEIRQAHLVSKEASELDESAANEEEDDELEEEAEVEAAAAANR